MTRTQSTAKIGTMTRTQVVLQSDPCKPSDRAYRFLKFEMLRAIADDPSLTQCGMADWTTLTISHNGNHWTAVAEAEAFTE